MPYTRIYLNKKTRKNLQRLAEKYDVSTSELLTQMVSEYYNLMPLFEAEVGDSYSQRKYRQATKARLGRLPVVRITWYAQAKLGKELLKAGQSRFRFLTRIVNMGQEELEYDLWRRAAKKQFLLDHNISRKELKRNTELLSSFWDYLENHPDNPGRVTKMSDSIDSGK